MERSDQLSFRVATPTDHPVIVQMMHELIDEISAEEDAASVKSLIGEDIRIALEAPHIRIFLAIVDGHMVGLGRADILTTDPIFRLRDDHRCGYIDQMFVRSGHRDQGIGAELLRLCENWFREQNIGHCLLHAAPKAVRFYARVGYQPNREMFKRL